jgi:hypothetical protein
VSGRALAAPPAIASARPERPHWLGRAEALALMTASALLILLHARQVHWARFAVAFVAIDLLGYLPGARAFRRAAGGRIAPLYHHLYNFTHNFLTAAVAIGLWAALGGGFEWAMLAVPLHLYGDRGLFGNGFKPAGRPFERPSRPEVAR